MTENDRAAFGELMARLGATFSEAVTPLRAAVYWDALVDLPIESVRAAVLGVIKTSRFFPRPVELRRPAELMGLELAARAEEPRLLLEGPQTLGRAIAAAADAAATVTKEAQDRAEWHMQYAQISSEGLHRVWAEQDAARTVRIKKHRSTTSGGNLFCPGCGTIVELVEGERAHWCDRCMSWLCSTGCFTQHTHKGH